MNARIKSVEQPGAGLLIVVSYKACSGLQQGRWTRIRRALGRIRLLLGAPIASFRWAKAKRRASSRKNEAAVESECDASVMGW